VPVQGALQRDQLALPQRQVVDEISRRGPACRIDQRDLVFADALHGQRVFLKGAQFIAERRKLVDG